MASCSSLAAFVAIGACAGSSTQATSSAEERDFEPAVEELWAVGGIAGEGWEIFSDRIQVAFDAEGRVRIFDALGGRVHLLERDGTYIRSWGEKGEGPGELSIPMDLVVHRDGSTSILDFGKRGFVQFDAAGEYVGELAMDLGRGMPTGGLLSHPDGSVIAAGNGMFMRMGARQSNDTEMTLPIRRFALDGTGVSVIHEAWSPPRPGSETGRGFSGGDHMMAFETVTIIGFQPELHVGVFPDGRLLVADSTTWTLDVLSPDGTVVAEYSRPHFPIPVTEEMQARERSRRIKELEDGGAGAGVVVMTALHGGGPSIQASGPSEAQLAQIESMLFAAELPVIDELAVDWEGRIWVERRTEDLSGTGPIDLLSADGNYLATIPRTGIRIPVAFGPDGLAAYIEFDEYDVPTVRIVRLGQMPG